ncbi:MAG: sigma 54-interacting transcriptional regulator [Planctomycetota bacterium]|jgi:DNA-binding NtrC family response regulator
MHPQSPLTTNTLDDPLLGPSEAARALRRRLPRIAAASSNVVIESESGNGREAIARRVHDLSRRSREAYFNFDCSCVPEDLLPRELFGHRAGAFTGADEDDPGKLRATSGGTFCLQHVDLLPNSGQGSLLRAIQQKEVIPLGASKAVPIDLRFLATSGQSLDERVDSGAFREDLYYRLIVVLVKFPPLRERPEDVSFYLDHYLRRSSRRERRPVPTLREDLRSLLLRHRWPGNLVELHGAVEGLLAFSERDFLTPHQAPPALLQRLERGAASDNPVREIQLPSELTYKAARELFERQLLQQSWREAGYDRHALADRLGLQMHQLRHLIKRLQIDLRDGRPNDCL